MKWWSICVGLFTVSSASASFDLMLLQANTLDPDTGGAIIHRYDPINKVTLGTFGIAARATAMVADYSRRELHTFDSIGWMRSYDYSNGTLKKAVFVGVPGAMDATLSADASRMYFVNGGTSIFTVNLSSGSVNTAHSGLPNLTRICRTDTGQFYTVDGISGMSRYSAGSNGALTHIEQDIMVNGFPAGRQMAVTSPAQGNPYKYVLAPAGSNVVLNVVNLDDSFSSVGDTSFLINRFGSYTNAVNSHRGVYIIGTDSTTSSLTRIIERDATGAFSNGSTIAGIGGGVYNAAVVLAPELGTMIAVGAGLAALLRRPRRTAG